MNKKTRLVSFDYEKYKSGAKAVFRDYKAEIVKIYPAEDDIYQFIFLCKIHNYFEVGSLTNEGKYNHIYESSTKDVLLIEETEEKTFYVNIYPDDDFMIQMRFNHSLETCIKQRSNDCLGTLKVTFTEKDLIK